MMYRLTYISDLEDKMFECKSLYIDSNAWLSSAIDVAVQWDHGFFLSLLKFLYIN